MDNKDIKKLRKKIEEVQDSKRFEHTLGVEFTAAALAMAHGCSIENARVAAILHDCAKCMSDDERLSVCKKYKIEVTDVERRNPFLLHSKVGAFYAGKKYDIEDEDIINAVMYHTTGRADMSLLEKIIFVADYIEPGRNKAQNLDYIRKMAFTDIDEAVFKILEDTLEYLRTGGGEIDPATEVTFHYYRNMRKMEV